ncbi:hypothetical protein PoB_001373100 [Plakobranchus ocellatus]|uniref:Uncharacterized protein n=1 Tax=Plakobranchus ocellatus TaxID=259542 RepID=A0AAV3YUW4_9GAST|nr:hypothetical protein PoB_001373100 [Plakobranchus ocellatus]
MNCCLQCALGLTITTWHYVSHLVVYGKEGAMPLAGHIFHCQLPHELRGQTCYLNHHTKLAEPTLEAAVHVSNNTYLETLEFLRFESTPSRLRLLSCRSYPLCFTAWLSLIRERGVPLRDTKDSSDK